RESGTAGYHLSERPGGALHHRSSEDHRSVGKAGYGARGAADPPAHSRSCSARGAIRRLSRLGPGLLAPFTERRPGQGAVQPLEVLRSVHCRPSPPEDTRRNDAQRRVRAGIHTRLVKRLPVDKNGCSRTDAGINPPRSLTCKIDLTECLDGALQEADVVL